MMNLIYYINDTFYKGCIYSFHIKIDSKKKSMLYYMVKVDSILKFESLNFKFILIVSTITKFI